MREINSVAQYVESYVIMSVAKTMQRKSLLCHNV